MDDKGRLLGEIPEMLGIFMGKIVMTKMEICGFYLPWREKELGGKGGMLG